MIETIELTVEIDEIERARQLANHAHQLGAEAIVEEQKGVLPLPVLLALVIPPGLGLLAKVVAEIVQHFRPGLIIDARGKTVRLKKDDSIPFGTVIVLTKDGDQAMRTDLPGEQLGDYISKVIGAIAGGAGASQALETATGG